MWGHFTMRELFGEFRTERGLLIFVGAIFLLTILGPFGSYEALSLAHRFIFWTAVLSAVAIPMHIAIRILLETPHLGALPRLGRIALGSMVAAVPGTGLVFFVRAVLWPTSFALDALPTTWFQVSAIGFAIGCFHFLPAGDEPGTESESVAPPAPNGHARFQSRLDPATGTDIVSLSMQDHYVQVSTTSGTQLVLIRFADALTELEALDGLRIHRSHWVALKHVTGITRDDGKLRAQLDDGRSLPVSQTYAKALRTRLAVRDRSA